MKGLLVRIGADSGIKGGCFNAPVDSNTRDFAYAPIPEDKRIEPGMETPYLDIIPALQRFNVQLPPHLGQSQMHLDPDFEHLTYGDENNRARQIQNIWNQNVRPTFLVFYAGMRDVNPNNRHLVYAIIGFYEIEEIENATQVENERRNENAHTRFLQPNENDIVVRAKPGRSGRLKWYIPIGSYRSKHDNPQGRKQYRVESKLLKEWGCLSVKDGWIQRSAILPEFKDPCRFLKWFKRQKPSLIQCNN
jgi:hypothetical protein